MAWRIDQQIERGELESLERGRVTGRIWLAGIADPIVLDLEGNPYRDLAGHRLVFRNPDPKPWLASMGSLASLQRGVVGDLTASHKVKVPDCPPEDVVNYYKSGVPMPFHWSNGLYLEWFSEANGRVVIESARFELELEPEAAWVMTEAEMDAQMEANRNAVIEFLNRLGEAAADTEEMEGRLRIEGEPAQSRGEAKADAEAARMDLLLDRITARIDREGSECDFDTIYEEERERLRRERGEPEPEPLTPEQEAEQSAWIEEMNAVCAEAQKEIERNGIPEHKDHPLVETCHDLGISLHWDVKNNEWVPEGATGEHPLYAITHNVQSASAKLAGALGMWEDGWPPDPLFAGDKLVRLKKARTYLHDALNGLDSADQEGLGDLPWRSRVRQEVNAILASVEQLITEVRSVLESDSD